MENDMQDKNLLKMKRFFHLIHSLVLRLTSFKLCCPSWWVSKKHIKCDFSPTFQCSINKYCVLNNPEIRAWNLISKCIFYRYFQSRVEPLAENICCILDDIDVCWNHENISQGLLLPIFWCFNFRFFVKKNYNWVVWHQEHWGWCQQDVSMYGCRYAAWWSWVYCVEYSLQQAFAKIHVSK